MMDITFFSVWMAVLWSSILILLFYVLRTRFILIDLCSVSGVIALYLFCMMRMMVPVEFPWTKVVSGGTFYNRIYYFLYIEHKIGDHISVFDLLLVLWLAGTFVILLHYGIQYRKIARYFSKIPAQKNSRAAQLSGTIWNGRRKRPEIIQTAAVDTPCCVGILRKKIILPDKPYSEKQLHFILLHECTHLRNHDTLVKNLINILCAFYWWNPCVYLLKKDLSQSMEIRCDAIVVKELDNQSKSEYLAVVLSEYKDRGDKTGNPRPLLERFRLVAETPPPAVRSVRPASGIFPLHGAVHIKGNILAWILAGCLLVLSYSFIIQTAYDPPKADIETCPDAHEIDVNNSWLIKTGDGAYLLHSPYDDTPISEDFARKMIEDGFGLVEECE